MGLFDTISGFFGGGEEETKIKQLATMTPEQYKLLEQLIATAGQAGEPAPTFPGELFLPATAEEQNYLDWARSEAIRKMAQGEVPYEVGPEYAEKYFEEAIRPIYQREWEETILPGIREAYAGPGYWSSARAEAERKGGRDYFMELAAKKAGLVYGEEQARRQAIESAMGRVLPTGQAMGEAGAYSRAIGQEEIMADLSRWLMGEEVEGAYNPFYSPAMTYAYNLLGIQPYAYGTETTAQGPGLGYGILTGLAGGAGSALASYFLPQRQPKGG